MLAQARHHFQEYHYEEQIRLIEGDALEMYDSVSDRLYDMIFIDAAKAQSKIFRVIHAFIKKRWARSN